MQSRRTLNRAKLFLSFDSLKGYKEIIHKKERVVVSKKELSEDDCYELDWKIHQIEIGKLIFIIYFDMKDYVALEGMITAIDLEYKKTITIVDKIIPICNIVKIEIDESNSINERNY